MGKLTFKGDKPKKRKRTGAVDCQEPVKKIKGENINLDGWSTASCVEDLKGPCMVIGEGDKDDKGALDNSCAGGEGPWVFQTEEDGFGAGSDVDVVEDTVNFFGGNDYPTIHKCEPKMVNQVLTLVPVNEYEKSRLNTTRTNRFAMRTHNGRYMSTTMGLVHAIGDNEIFTFTKVDVTNESFGYEEPQWEISSGGKRCVLEWSVATYKMRFLEEDKIDKINGVVARFVVRVHSKNTIEGSRIHLNDTETDNGPNVNKIVRQLYKDTNGKIEITRDLVKRLRKAIATGDINEQVIQEKARYLSKW